MPVIAWDDAYSVGVPSLDDDHKRLINLINDLIAAADGSAEAHEDGVEGVFEDLMLYAKLHFSREEDMMERAGYPGLADHQEQHRQLVSQVLEFYRQFLSEGETNELNDEARDFLKRWLLGHILDTDMAYRPFLT